MRMHYLQHVPYEGPGNLYHWAKKNNFQLSSTHLYQDDLIPAPDQYDLLIILGGPMNVYDEAKYPFLLEEKKTIEQAMKQKKYILGICLGSQLIAEVLGSAVKKNRHKEIGWFNIHLTKEAKSSHAFQNLPDIMHVFHWHGDTFDLPKGSKHLAFSRACENQAFLYGERVIGLQYHFETTGEIARLLMDHCREDMEPDDFVQQGNNILQNEQDFIALTDYLNIFLNNIKKQFQQQENIYG